MLTDRLPPLAFHLLLTGGEGGVRASFLLDDAPRFSATAGVVSRCVRGTHSIPGNQPCNPQKTGIHFDCDRKRLRYLASAAGSSRQKVLPVPGVELTLIVPCIRSAARRTMASPIPWPW